MIINIYVFVILYIYIYTCNNNYSLLSMTKYCDFLASLYISYHILYISHTLTI